MHETKQHTGVDDDSDIDDVDDDDDDELNNSIKKRMHGKNLHMDIEEMSKMSEDERQ